MLKFLEACFSWPTLPATALLLLVAAYWAFVSLGALDLDFADVDLDGNLQADGEVLSFGFVVLRWLNLGEVPLMVWLTVFAISMWMLSMLIDGRAGGVTESRDIALSLLRDAGLAVVATKVLTQPLRGKFDPSEPYRSQDLVGKTCVIKSAEATPAFGQAEFKTDGSPLYLHVRTVEGTLPKGEVVEIVDFDAGRHVYLVTSANRKAKSDA